MMPTSFDERLEAMNTAKAQSDIAFNEAMTAARDAYVQAGNDHIINETAWMSNPSDSAAQATAEASWQGVLDAREALLAALGTATSARQQALDEAWATIKDQE